MVKKWTGALIFQQLTLCEATLSIDQFYILVKRKGFYYSLTSVTHVHGFGQMICRQVLVEC